jgi:excisionase family DNA binding protein
MYQINGGFKDLVSSISFLPLEPAALRLGLPVTYLRKLADNGDVPFLQVGNRRLFNIEDVSKALRESHTEQRRARP